MSGFRHLGDREVASLARIRVVTGTFEAPDGSTFERDIVRNQEVVAVVPVLDDGETVLLVRQYRGPVDRTMLEIPAGLCDVEGEDPVATARRELVEEVGRTAGQLEQVAAYFPSAGFSDQFVRLYVGTDLHEVPHDRQGPEEEHMTIEPFALRDLDAAIADGTIADSKTLIGLLLARDRFCRR